MNQKKVISVLMAGIMSANLGLADMNIVRAADEAPNLALGTEVTASDAESVNPAENAVDGDASTHWATNQSKMNDQWIELDLKVPTEVHQVKILWERHTEEKKNYQNIKKWKVEVLQEDNTWVTAAEDADSAYSDTESVIEPDTPVTASKIRVTVVEADNRGNYWANIGISEIEVYGEAQDVEAAENRNHMSGEGVAVTASSEEAGTLTADKVKDGKTGRQDRWACKEYTYEGEWLKTVFPKVTKVQEIDFTLFERDVEPIPSNIKGFDIEYRDLNGAVQTVHVDNVQADGRKGYQTDLTYVFENPVYMSEFTVKNFDVAVENPGNGGYNNVSISEIEVYSNDRTSEPEQPTLESVTASVKGQTVEADVTALELPSVPEGFSIESNGADFEQIIGEAGEDGTLPVVHPLTDKTVKVSFNITEEATGETQDTGDLDFVVKGTMTQEDGKNAKPVIIPEIQEWYSDSEAGLSTDSLDKVVYSDDALEAVVDEFVSDYEDFTGVTLEKVRGAARSGAICFVREAPDSLLGEEGYTMDIQSDRIIVKSESVTGNMYGMQTILQMYKQNPESFAIGQMRDYPRFRTRGFMLDVARKPVSLEMMKQVTRTMRYYKMNDFQAHLNDNYIWLEDYGIRENEDEGFQAYEAFRLESDLKNENGETPTAKDYSISKEEFKQFIQEERELGMNIVPEIDVPAHAVSFTKVWPELKIENQVSSGHSLIDHFDLTKPEAVAKIKEIFDDYTGDGTFDSETTVHVGADEFLYNAKSYREFVNDIVPYVKKTNTVRMWGGLTRIKDDPLTQISSEAIENVEINLWSRDWADGLEMYEMGYNLINTIDDYGYMVPSGSLTRANSYGDLLNVSRIFSSFEPNLVRTASGYEYIPSGDDQMLGAAFALWSDNIDKRASGLSESDLYWRFFDAMPFYAEKTWAATGKEKGSADALSELAQQLGTGPNTNPYYQEDKTGEDYAEYDFEDGLKDVSENGRDLESGKNADAADNALVLGGGESYVTTPIEQLGNGNQLSFDITLDQPAEPGDILFEEDAPYGTHDIRIMEDGKLGFTRELYNYYFDYELPIGKTVNITIKTDQQRTELYVDGVFTDTAEGKFIHNGIVKKENITNATFALPLERIGSKTDAISAELDNIVISSRKSEADIYNKASWTGTANTETVNAGEKEGEIEKAFDNNLQTHWHSDWTSGTDKVESADGTQGTIDEATAEITFDKGYEISQISFTPRQDAESGYVTEASLYIKTEDGSWKEVAKDQIFAADKTKKTFCFDPQTVYGFKFVATQSSDGWVTVSEFDIANETEEEWIITSVEQIPDLTVDQGTALETIVSQLPDTVEVTYGDGEKTEVAVEWDGSAYDGNVPGEYSITGMLRLSEDQGIVNPDQLTATVKVVVKETAVPETEYTVTVRVKDGQEAMGTAAADRPDGIYEEGAEAAVTARAEVGYVFAGWTDAEGNTVSTENPYIFNVTGDTVLTAEFEKAQEENPGEEPGENPGQNTGEKPSDAAEKKPNKEEIQGGKAVQTGDAAFPAAWASAAVIAAAAAVLAGKKRGRPGKASEKHRLF